MISATAPLTDGAPATSERTSATSAPVSSSVRRSMRTRALQELVDGVGLELVRDRVRDQARRADRELLADHEVVLAQRGARRREIDDRLDEPRQGRQLDRPLDLDDLRLAAG